LAEQNVLWIASFPKSGNTWVASVLATSGCEFGYAQGKYDAYNLEAKDADPEYCANVDESVLGGKCAILKTHAPYEPGGLPHRFRGAVPVSRGFIHIVRNPLDVLLSYIGFTRLEYSHRPRDARYRKRLFVDLLGFAAPVEADRWRGMGIDSIPRENLDHALDTFSRDRLSIAPVAAMSGSWIEHFRSWRTAAIALPGCMLWYEDCLADPRAFAPMAELVTVGRERIVESTAKVGRLAEQASSGGSERDRIFFNKRKAYYFRDYFSRAAIDRFLDKHDSELQEAGYGASSGRMLGEWRG